jgi:succinate-semialdehyde dehydrogenase/glutarate-semialdehyde dehydrogenase
MYDKYGLFIDSGWRGGNGRIVESRVPGGRIKASGMGREGGAENILDFLNIKLSHVAV